MTLHFAFWAEMPVMHKKVLSHEMKRYASFENE